MTNRILNAKKNNIIQKPLKNDIIYNENHIKTSFPLAPKQEPCQNGGILVDHTFVGYSNKKCLCNDEYTGQLCEIKLCSDAHLLIANHSMCTKNSPNLLSGGISDKEKEFILETHNALRRKVFPHATNMQKMYWDAKLQTLAQKRAQLCSADKIDILMRQEPGYGKLKQAIYLFN